MRVRPSIRGRLRRRRNLTRCTRIRLRLYKKKKKNNPDHDVPQSVRTRVGGEGGNGFIVVLVRPVATSKRRPRDEDVFAGALVVHRFVIHVKVELTTTPPPQNTP